MGPLVMDQLRQGMELPAMEMEPITRVQLARYAGASGDFNGIHVDPEAAARAGLGDVIAHGMLSMGFCGRYAEALAGPNGRVVAIRASFRAMVRVGDRLTVHGQVSQMESEGDGLLTAAVKVVNQANTPVTVGETTLWLAPRGGEAT